MSLDLAFRLAMQDKAIAKSLGEFISKKKVLSVKGLEPNSLRKIAEIKADKVYEMLLEDNELAIFHFEVQGKSSHRDMALRMFDYITRIISQSGDLNVRIYSVVIYINGAGADDDGHWTFGNPPIGHFQYTPLKLWELDGDIFLDGDNINLLAFLPQMKLSRPKEQLITAMQRMHDLEDKDHAARLLYILAALTQKKGLKPVVDLFISQEMMLEAPDFIRNAYLKARHEGLAEGEAKGLRLGRKEGEAKGHKEGEAKGRKEGEAKGRKEGEAKGRKEGEAKGRKEGEAQGEERGLEKGLLQAKMDSVLKLVRLRFQPGDFDYQAIQHNLETFDIDLLDKSFEQSLQAESLDDVKTWFSSLKA